MRNFFLSYFGLGLLEEDMPKEPILGKKNRNKEVQKAQERKKIIWTLVLYFGVVLGVVGQQFLTNMASFNSFTLFVSTILGTVVFPLVYKQANLDAMKPNLMQFFVAFQNGFFWQNLMSALEKLMEGP